MPLLVVWKVYTGFLRKVGYTSGVKVAEAEIRNMGEKDHDREPLPPFQACLRFTVPWEVVHV